MIEQADRFLKTWITQVIGDVPISGQLQPADDAPCVILYLLQVTPTIPDGVRPRQRPPLQVELRYLLTTHATDDDETAHRLLGELIFAALDTTDFEVIFEPFALADWLALGQPPRPAFVIKMPLVQERPQPEVPRVRQPLVAQVSTLTLLRGVILGPGDLPIAYAHIELPGLQFSTRADSQGRFELPAVRHYPQQMIIRAKGHEQTVPLDAAGESPLVIHFDLELKE